MLFSPFLFVSFYIWPERIDSVADLHYATVLLQEPITRLGSITRRACMRDEGSRQSAPNKSHNVTHYGSWLLIIDINLDFSVKFPCTSGIPVLGEGQWKGESFT